MTLSIWRYSHLTLAISSSLFILLAAVTGIILAFEPINSQLTPFAMDNHDKQLSVATTISNLKREYDEVITLEIDHHHFVLADVITKDGQSQYAYIDPETGKKIGDKIEKSSIFKFATTLHRSLFLKKIGRFFVGLTSFLLFLITISGIILIIKRQGSFKKFFSKIVNENFKQYYHIIFGRLSIVPIVIITLTGVYLSLEKFSLLPNENIKHEIIINDLKTSPKLAIENFEIFKNTTLKEIRQIQFPFSTDVEDHFIVELKNKELVINQITGEVLSEQVYPFTKIASYYSFILHTGQGSILWSVILLLASIAILFFLYSGFAMTLKRRQSRIKNQYKSDDCEYVILIGSENGSTLNYANAFHQQLLKQHKRSFLTELNNYKSFKKIEHLIIITATYGQGEAPSNAAKFEQLLKNTPFHKDITYSVVGFGSHAYPNYCQFAYNIESLLAQYTNTKPLLDIYTVNNGSFEMFTDWINAWSEKMELSINIKKKDLGFKKVKTQPFTTLSKTEKEHQIDDTFLLTLAPGKKTLFNSGDLLAIYPKNDDKERLYSIGKIADNIVISVKRHQKGLISNYLHQLDINQQIQAGIIRNKSFYFPKKANQVILIATGTGIGPFLGMLASNHKTVDTHLFWGGRNEASFSLYSSYINTYLDSKKLKSFHPAFSRATTEKVYVQDLIKTNDKLFSTTLNNKGVIMICGSLAMQKEVLDILDAICSSHLKKPLSYYQNNQQLLMDCY